jgi:hypothetical protein
MPTPAKKSVANPQGKFADNNGRFGDPSRAHVGSERAIRLFKNTLAKKGKLGLVVVDAPTEALAAAEAKSQKAAKKPQPARRPSKAATKTATT